MYPTGGPEMGLEGPDISSSVNEIRVFVRGPGQTMEIGEVERRVRAVHLDKDWDSFWKYKRKCERRRFYGFEDIDSPEIRDHELQRGG
jgi:hypothetical protein